MAQAITPEMRELQMEVYQAGEDVGMQLPGRSDWGEFAEKLAGSQRDPLLNSTSPDPSGVKIGMSGEMTVAVGAEGQLVNQARHRREGDAPSTHLLKIHVTPTVTFGVDGNVPIIRWIANVSVFELTNAHMVIGKSSADDAGERALAGNRPKHVYGNDPVYRAARPGFLHETPREAVRAALEKISSGGLINLPGPPDPSTSAPIAPTPVPVARVETADGGRPGWLLPVVGLAGIAAVIALLLAFTGGDDSEAETAATPAPTVSAAATASSAVTAAAVAEQPATTIPAVAPPESTDAVPTSTVTTTTEPPVVISETVFEFLDQRCVVSATGEPGEACSFPSLIALAETDPPTLRIELPDGTTFGPDVVGAVSLFLTDGPANDILLECDTTGTCQFWAAPSYYNVEWFTTDFFSLSVDQGVGFIVPITDVDRRALLDLPAGETQQEQIPAGTYSIGEGLFYIEQDGLQSTTLFASQDTFWFQ